MPQMNSSEQALYQRLQDFTFDRPDAQFSFSQRLAREQNWSPLYTQRILTEYKKFAFLAVVADHPVTPSKQVDQAWHLHLTYTRSYWQEFCPEVLGQPLHHEPTNGGQTEQQKFFTYYQQTLDSYRQFFGHQPPADIWPNVADRFQPLHQQWLSRTQNWVIPKPASWPEILGNLSRSLKEQIPQNLWSQWHSIGLIILCCTLFLSGCVSNSINPLDWSGSEFLTVYIPLSILSSIIAFVLRDRLRLPYQSNLPVPEVVLDSYEIAYLSSPEQAVDAAIVSLLEQDLIEVSADTRNLRLKDQPPISAHPLEVQVAEAIKTSETGSLAIVRSIGLQKAHNIHQKLKQMQLLLSDEQAKVAKLYPTLLITLMLLLGLVRLIVGYSKGRPVGYLIMIGLALLFVVSIIWSTPFYRSNYGDRVWQHLKKKFSEDWSQNPNPNYILAYTFLGVTALGDPIFDDFRTIISPSPSTSVIGSDGSGGCGGGGCGGGCGGCGGGCGG
jgi:uncharacterized protein (TIGR04222 family)